MRLFFMSYVRGEDRGQAALLPAAIEDYVAADAPVRAKPRSSIPSCRRPAPRPRHGDFGLPKRAGQHLCPAAVPVTGDAHRGCDAITVLRSPAIARARQNRRELAFDQLFDEASHPIANRVLNRIEPIVEKTLVRVRLQSARRNAIAHHGVVSCPALQRQAIRG